MMEETKHIWLFYKIRSTSACRVESHSKKFSSRINRRQELFSDVFCDIWTTLVNHRGNLSLQDKVNCNCCTSQSFSKASLHQFWSMILLCKVLYSNQALYTISGVQASFRHILRVFSIQPRLILRSCSLTAQCHAITSEKQNFPFFLQLQFNFSAAYRHSRRSELRCFPGNWHSRPQGPRSFWSAPRIATSGPISFRAPTCLLISTKTRSSGIHSGQTTGHSREHARVWAHPVTFPLYPTKFPRSTSATRAISVLSSIILPVQTCFSQFLLLR